MNLDTRRLYRFAFLSAKWGPKSQLVDSVPFVDGNFHQHLQWGIPTPSAPQ
jgi:hypothetical protein